LITHYTFDGMFPFTQHLCRFLFLAGMAIAIPWDGPKPTLVQQTPYNVGWSVKPTYNPQIEEFDTKHVLFGRQETGGSTCGYFQEDIGRPFVCVAAHRTCIYNPTVSVVGCCLSGFTSAGAGCGFWTSCIDAVDTCDSACQTDTSILRCTSTASPACRTYSFLSGYVMYGCDLSRSINNIIIPNSAQPVPYGPAPTNGQSSKTGSATASNSAATVQPPQVNRPGSKHISTGVIAGAVVGGLAGAAVLGGVLGYILRRYFSGRGPRLGT